MAALLPPLPSPRRAIPLDAAERRLLADAAGRGIAIARALMAGLPPGPAGAAAASAVVYRRWVLDVLLVLRVRGEAGFNDLSRELGGLAGESLAVKLAALSDARLIERREAGGRPRRVRYRLAGAGRALGSATLALTHAKIEHSRALREGAAPPRPSALLAPATEPQMRDALARYVDDVEGFARERLARGPEDVATVLATARRFSETCVRKWHGAVLSTLLLGPRRFADLRAATGAGDEALSRALTTLEALGSVARDERGAYAVQPPGETDVGMGTPLLLLVPSAQPLHPA